MKLFLLIIGAFISQLSFAQALLVPGKNIADRKWVKNNASNMQWFMFRDTAKIEIGEINTETVLHGTHIIVVTRVALKNAQSPWVDSTIADLETLTPIRHTSINMQREMALDFGKIITGYYTDKAKATSTKIVDSASLGYFDSNLYPVLLGWLPLKDGYHHEISIYDYSPAKSGLMRASVTAVKSGTYLSKKGPREVWIVSVTDQISNGITTYYFDKADRVLWKQEIELNGRKMLLERRM